jgi:hypothetical protein
MTLGSEQGSIPQKPTCETHAKCCISQIREAEGMDWSVVRNLPSLTIKDISLDASSSGIPPQ